MKRIRGNILFLILLAVILFAALSYAVTSSMRGGGNNASGESARTGAGAILQYMTLIRSQVQRLMLTNDCRVENLDFRTAVYMLNNTTVMNVTAPPVPKTGCAVFTDQGGPITPQTFEKYADPAYTYPGGAYKPGHFDVQWASQINNGTSESDIILQTFGIRHDVCRYMMSMDNPANTIPNDQYDFYPFALNAQNAPPTITGTARIGDAADNNGDIFATDLGGFCLIGTVLISR